MGNSKWGGKYFLTQEDMLDISMEFSRVLRRLKIRTPGNVISFYTAYFYSEYFKNLEPIIRDP
jgi:hypothetical protein